MRISMTASCASARRAGSSAALLLVTYPVNRALDALDVVSVDVGIWPVIPAFVVSAIPVAISSLIKAAPFLFGGQFTPPMMRFRPVGGATRRPTSRSASAIKSSLPPVFLDVHVTRALQLSLGFCRYLWELGWWQDRQLGVGWRTSDHAAIGPWSSEKHQYTRSGTQGRRHGNFREHGVNKPSDMAHRGHRDYWGVGAGAGFLVSAQVEFHPLELLDAILGFAFIDFKRDDIGHKR